ncbi:MAG TPA: tripartite tricarboxylate transporter substrate-binding protein [Xanthobacteraceae bacterium]|nr:tripartite tricarboxylate transporter substrate-binding protein [Xanthobacteraceae bacterium]
MMRRTRWGFAIPPMLLLALLLLGPQVLAQTFSPGTIRIVVPTAPSTPPDIISRVIAQRLAADKDWNVVVENKPGAVMTLAGTEVLRQPADGTSIYALSLPVSAAPAFVADMPFNLSRDFAPLIKVAVSYNVLVVNPSLPVHSVSDLVGLLKSKPNQLTFSSGGYGTPAHLIGELFEQRTGTHAIHVPYQQFPQAIGDLISGTNQFMFVAMLPVVDLIKAGKLRALAVTAPKRVPALADVPSIVEEGYPDLVVEDWTGFDVKTGTPSDTVNALNSAINAALTKPDVRAALANLGATPAGGTPAAFGEFVKSEMSHWAQVVKTAGLKIQQ